MPLRPCLQAMLEIQPAVAYHKYATKDGIAVSDFFAPAVK
jgi:hypothetical protein